MFEIIQTAVYLSGRIRDLPDKDFKTPTVPSITSLCHGETTLSVLCHDQEAQVD